MIPVSEAVLHHNTSLVPVSRGQDTSTFFFDRHPIRVTRRVDGEPMFVAADICQALHLRDVSDAVGKLDEDEKGRASIPTPGGLQDLLVVTEGGMMTMILRCRGATTPGTLPHRFRRWVTGDVLPSIRRTGSYGLPQAPFAIDVRDPKQISVIALQLLQVNQELAAEVAETRQALATTETRAVTAEAIVEEQRPMVDAYLTFLDDDGLCSLSTAARAIDAPQGLFFEWLRERGYCFDREGFLQPRADLRKDGHLKVKMGPAEYGRRRPQTMVTRSGLVWLRHRWISGPGKVLALQAAVASRQGSLPGL